MAHDPIKVKYLWLPSLAVFAFGVLLFWHPWSYWVPKPLAEIVRGMGEAFIIAAVLALTVDGYIKKHIIKEMSRDIFGHIFGHALPIELRGRINQMVRVDKIFRDFRIHYRLTELGNRQIRVDVLQEYELENLSDRVLRHPPAVSWEEQDNPTILEFRCDSKDDEESRFCYSAGERG